MSTEALKALEAYNIIDHYIGKLISSYDEDGKWEELGELLEALTQASEPVGWLERHENEQGPPAFYYKRPNWSMPPGWYLTAVYTSPQPPAPSVTELELEVKALRAMLLRAIQPVYDESKIKAGYNYSLQACPFANAEVEAVKKGEPVAGLLRRLCGEAE